MESLRASTNGLCTACALRSLDLSVRACMLFMKFFTPWVLLPRVSQNSERKSTWTCCSDSRVKARVVSRRGSA